MYPFGSITESKIRWWGSLAQIYRGGKQPAWMEEAMLTLNPNHCGHGIEGEIAEFCMFADALNAADRQALLAHISTKYRIGARVQCVKQCVLH